MLSIKDMDNQARCGKHWEIKRYGNLMCISKLKGEFD